MIVPLQIRIENNPYLIRYLREHSYWYKYLNREPSSINMLEDEMRTLYKLRPEDKLDKLSNNIKLISTFMDINK